MTLKVIEVKKQTSEIGSVSIICIMKNVSNPEELFSARCEDLNEMQKVTSFYKEAESKIRNSGNAHILLHNYYSEPKLKLISKEGDKKVYEVHSIEELDALIGYNIHSELFYDSFASYRPSLMIDK